MSDSVLGKPWHVRKISYAEAEEIGLDNLPGNRERYRHSSYSNFVVSHEEYGLIGKAELYESPEYVIMEAAEIPDEDHRGLEFDGTSPFADLIEIRMDQAGDRDMKTSAVSEHGKTQHKYSQYGFTTTGVMPLPDPECKPYFLMWNGDFEDQDVFVDPELEEFIEASTEGLFETRFREASKPELRDRGYRAKNRGPQNGPLTFKIDSGSRKPEDIAYAVDKKSEIQENYVTSVRMDLDDPATQALTGELYRNGYRPLRVEVPNSSIKTSPRVVMGKLNRDIEDLEATEDTLDLMNKSGLNFEVEKDLENSFEVTWLENEAD